MASEEKVGRLKQLMDSGKEKGYVLYDEVNELLTEEKNRWNILIVLDRGEFGVEAKQLKMD